MILNILCSYEKCLRSGESKLAGNPKVSVGISCLACTFIDYFFYRANKKEDAVKHLAVPRQYSVLSRPPQAEITRQNVSILTAAILFFLTGIYSETEQTDRQKYRHENR